MKSRTAISILLFALFLSVLPFAAFAKKGGNGNGGGKPGGGGGGDDGGGGTPVLTGQPAMAYVTRPGQTFADPWDLIFSNIDGTAKKVMLTGVGHSPAFIPGENAVIVDTPTTQLTKMNYGFDSSNEPVTQSTQVLDQIEGDYSSLDIIKVSPSGDWVAYRVSLTFDPAQDISIRFQRTASLELLDQPVVVQLRSSGYIVGLAWLSDTCLAVAYRANDASWVGVFEIDPSNPPVGMPQPLLTYELPENDFLLTDRSIEGIDTIPGAGGIVMDMEVWTEEYEKVQGIVRKVYESVVFELLFDYADPLNSVFQEMSPLVIGRNPRMSLNGEFVLTEYNIPTGGRFSSDAAIIRTSTDPNVPESERQIVIEQNNVPVDPVWNPSWTPPSP